MDIKPPFSWAKEALVVLFRGLPGHFVLVGGGALYWIYHSPRLSVDLDLKPVHPAQKNLLHQMVVVLRKRISACGCSVAGCHSHLSGHWPGRGRPRSGRWFHSTLRIELVSLSPIGGNGKHLLQERFVPVGDHCHAGYSSASYSPRPPPF